MIMLKHARPRLSFTCGGRCAMATGPVAASRAAGHAPARGTSAMLNEAERERSLMEWGHLAAALNPVALMQGQGAVDAHGKAAFMRATGLDADDPALAPWKNVYCGTLAIEFTHVSNKAARDWWITKMREINGDPSSMVTPSERRNGLISMIKADVFEEYLQLKYPTYKRYSGEGADSMHACLEEIAQSCALSGVDDIVIAMAHRGKLAYLVGSLQYPIPKLIHKIRGNSELPFEDVVYGVDDVTSHLAMSVEREYQGKKIHISLVHSPSHLEIAAAVAIGKSRAKSLRGRKAVPLLVHGDAAVSGQGCIAEAGALWNLPGFTVGGSLHLVVNNRIGFTTDPADGRSGFHCTDFAKAIDAPIIHVNGACADSSILAAKLAVEFRQSFKSDVVIDLHGFRRYGHNEVDEPALTQPALYTQIQQLPNPTLRFENVLSSCALISTERIMSFREQFRSHLDTEGKKADQFLPSKSDIDAFKGLWEICKFSNGTLLRESIMTGAPAAALQHIAVSSVTLPEGFKIHPRLEKSFISKRIAMLADEIVDWATAETLAFGTLMVQGHNVRLCGQDVQRGTFSQRHAVFTSQTDGSRYSPLENLQGATGCFGAINSNLSELAVLGFEYGFSIDSPTNLVVWEAQFGDFANTAQVVIDQFLATGEAKWFRQSSLTLLLPHGMDGAGPEHSTARPERFLQLCDTPFLQTPANGDDEPSFSHDTNLHVAWPSTPSSLFHLIRRQQLRPFRKPLVVVVPKTLLRHPKAVSPLAELAEGTCFRPVLDDPSFIGGHNINYEKSSVSKVVLCNGKLYYDLKRVQTEKLPVLLPSLAFVRLEEIAPFPFRELKLVLETYPNVTEIIWAQEEPLNAGCWLFVKPHIDWLLFDMGKNTIVVKYAGRPSLPAPAMGLSKDNARQHDMVLQSIFI